MPISYTYYWIIFIIFYDSIRIFPIICFAIAVGILFSESNSYPQCNLRNDNTDRSKEDACQPLKCLLRTPKALAV